VTPEAVRSRVLWLSNETPDLAGQGGQRRQYFQIRELVRAGVDVDVMTLAGPQDDASLRALGNPVRRVRLHRRFGLPDPLGRAIVSRAVRSPAYDGLIVAHVESWSMVDRALRGTSARVLVDLHNVLSTWAAGQGRLDEAQGYFAVEADILARAEAVSTCSPAEATRLRPGGRARRIVLPHGIEPDEWPQPGHRAGPPAVGAIGNWDWAPNTNGIAWFVERVWPTVRDRVPGAEFLVAGTGLPESLANAPGVRYLGRVSDRRQVVSHVDVIAVPVLDGVGAPVKFGEALGSGRAVIATPDGASAHPEAPAFVSGDAAAWADVLTTWLGDARLAAIEGERTRRYAFERLTWRRTVAPLVDWVRTGR
jgi:polysaccharide biosynthesis protein PslH